MHRPRPPSVELTRGRRRPWQSALQMGPPRVVPAVEHVPGDLKQKKKTANRSNRSNKSNRLLIGFLELGFHEAFHAFSACSTF